METQWYDLETLVNATIREERLEMLIKWAPILAIIVVLAAVTWLARKRWPVVTVLLYSLWVTAVFTPALPCIVFWLSDPDVPDLEEVYDSILMLYGEFWPFWIFCAILIVSQMLLLIIPVKIVKKRPKPRRGLWLTAIAAGGPFFIVVVGVVWSVAGGKFGGDSLL